MLLSEIFCFTIMPINQAAHAKNTWLLGTVVPATVVTRDICQSRTS